MQEWKVCFATGHNFFFFFASSPNDGEVLFFIKEKGCDLCSIFAFGFAVYFSIVIDNYIFQLLGSMNMLNATRMGREK